MSLRPEKRDAVGVSNLPVVAATQDQRQATLVARQTMATPTLRGVYSTVNDEKGPRAFVLVTVTKSQLPGANQKKPMASVSESSDKPQIVDRSCSTGAVATSSHAASETKWAASAFPISVIATEGDLVPLYLTIHRSPGLSQEEIGGYVPDVKKNVHAQFRNLFVNLDEGYIVTVYEGDSEAAVHSEFERIGWPWDTTTEIQFTLDRAGLDAMPV